MRRKCSLSYMVWTVFLGLSFTLNFLWIEWKIKWHLSRMFLSFEPCRPTSTTLHSLWVLWISVRILSESQFILLALAFPETIRELKTSEAFRMDIKMNKNVFLSYLEFIWIKTRQIHWKKTHFVNTEQLQDIRSEKLETS